jgi:hypothetical protein
MSKCKCGFPIPPIGRTMKEGFFGEKRIIVEYDLKCRECGRINKVKG